MNRRRLVLNEHYLFFENEKLPKKIFGMRLKKTKYRIIGKFAFNGVMIKLGDKKIAAEKVLIEIANETWISEQKIDVSFQSLEFIKSLQAILPKRYREEFIGDITEFSMSLRDEGHSKLYITWCLLLQGLCIVWVSFRLKWREYFGTQPNSEKSDI